MRKQQIFQLVAGKKVALKGVPVSWSREGWLGQLFPWFWPHTAVIDLAVVQGQNRELCIEARGFSAGPVRIPHRHLFEPVCPPKLSPHQKTLWLILRTNFAKAIASYEKKAKEAKERRQQELQDQIHDQIHEMALAAKLPAEARVVLPMTAVITTELHPTRPTQLRPVSVNKASSPLDVPLATPLSLVEAPSITVKKYERFKAAHLTSADRYVGSMYIRMPNGSLGLTRSQFGADYQLVLEEVPDGHCLFPVYHEAKLKSRKVWILIGSRGPIASVVGSPASQMTSYLVNYFKHDLDCQAVDVDLQSLCG